ncbi:MAG TPA: NnrS family protein [Thermoanaerobaculia bacterium]
MNASARIDPKLPVKSLLDRYPHLRSALASRGLEACCGGQHPLEQACLAKGVPLQEVIADLQAAHAAVEAHSLVPPTMSVREVRRRFPATIPVLERYGLGDCGGDEGPEEPLAWFATVHRLPLEEFLRDVREAAAKDAAAAPPPPATAAARPFSPHFILGSLFLTLTLGATTGMINLLRIAAGADVPISHRQIHGHTQVLGFAALFLMGIAFHALPRILGIGGARPRLARTAFWMMFVGVLLRNVGQPLGFYPAGRMLSLASALLEGAAAFLFAQFVFSLLRTVREGKYDRSDPLLQFVRAGTVFFLAAMMVNAAQGIYLAGHLETALPAALTEPFYFLALQGFLLAWIYGFGNRLVSLFLGVGPAVRMTPQAALAAQALGVVLYAASCVPGHAAEVERLLREGGQVLVALSAVLFLAGHGFLWRRPVFPAMRVPGAPMVAIRLAFGCLGLWSLLTLASVTIGRTTTFPAGNLWWSDAARHVFGVGFLTLLIVGMSFRVLPVFSGKTLWSPKLAYATYALLLLATAMRLLQYPAAFEPAFYEVGSYMGVPAVLALVLFTFNLFRTMRPGIPSGARRPVPAPAPALVSTLPVRN